METFSGFRLFGLVFAFFFLLGATSTVNGDYCEVNVCHNGATCVNGSGSTPFICICPEGFKGDTCNSTEKGLCSTNPCKNNGTCEVIGETRRGDVFTEYMCECVNGFGGVHCQNREDDCVDRLCRNGGSCHRLDGRAGCRCPSPYVGEKCQRRCISRLGMEGGGISESQISSSSVRYGLMGLQRWGPELSRLNNKGLVNAWTPAAHDMEPWIQVKMQRMMRFTGIVTQGASRMGSPEFVKGFKVAWSTDGQTFNVYRRKDMVFVGNKDNDGTKTNLFDPPILARYLRVVPVLCRNACSLRMELVGCEIDGCSEPLGIKSRLISDNQFQASSTFHTWGLEAFTWQPHYARLDKQGKTNAWSAATNSRSEWLQVDLGAPKRVTGIITQGAKDFWAVHFVSAFKVAYSNNSQTWTVVKDARTNKDKIFPGNSDNNVHKTNIFEQAVTARFIRVLPWAWHERITLRMELLGCEL